MAPAVRNSVATWRNLARPFRKAQAEDRTILFVDEAGFYLLPFVARTYAPIGQTPILRAPLTYDHLSVISAVTPDGRLFTHMQKEAFRFHSTTDRLRRHGRASAGAGAKVKGVLPLGYPAALLLLS